MDVKRVNFVLILMISENKFWFGNVKKISVLRFEECKNGYENYVDYLGVILGELESIWHD